MLACEVYKIRGDKNAYMNNEYMKAKQEQIENQKEVEKLQKKIDNLKEEKKQEKEYKKDYFIAVRRDLQTVLKRCFDEEGTTKAYIHLRLKKTREDVILHVGESAIERDWLEDNYEKELEKVRKIYENDEKARMEILAPKLLEEAKKIQEQKEKEERKKNIFHSIIYIIGQIFKWIFLIFFGGIYFIFRVISGLAK